MTMRIDLERDSVLNGESIRGRAEWVSSGKEPRKIEVSCRWRIAGRANKHEDVVGSEVEENLGSRSQVTIPFEFKIPIAGPLSYEGQQFSVIWEIVATADLPYAFDEEEKKTFTVKPRVFVKEEFAEDEDDDDDDDDDEDQDEGS